MMNLCYTHRGLMLDLAIGYVKELLVRRPSISEDI